MMLPRLQQPGQSRPAKYVVDSLPRAVLGITFVVIPTRVARAASSAVGRDPRDPVTVAVVLLGVRHLLEAAILQRHPRRDVLRTIVGVDLLHATSMAALAWRSRTYRRPALVSFVSTTTLATLGAMTVHAHRGDDPAPSTEPSTERTTQ